MNHKILSVLMILFSVSLIADENLGQMVKVEKTKLGQILTDSGGMTLYIFTPDKENKSTCYKKCAKVWPPLLAKDHAMMVRPMIRPMIYRVGSEDEERGSKLKEKLGVTTRRDNSRQVTYEGKPLYYYYLDKKSGDTKGEGLQNKWYVVKVNQ